MSTYHPFVLPFIIGLYGLILFLIVLYISWFKKISKPDKIKLVKYLLSYKIFILIKEIFLEVLLHRRIFKKNFVLGYMHTSLALGWLLLIVSGTVESKLNSHHAFNNPWQPIFLKFFSHSSDDIPHAGFFHFWMDFLLLIVLSGVFLALFKRVRSKTMGMKHTTKQTWIDRFALGSLWFIFPLRLIAESLTVAQYHNGGFLTGTVGSFFAEIIPTSLLPILEINAWWAYSIALFTFFAFLPFSRYMHIPTESFHIALKNAGLKPSKANDGITKFQVQSCSRCGVCIDVCQLNNDLKRNKMLPAYYLRSERFNQDSDNQVYDCLMCGRCAEACPVKLDINTIRQNRRILISDLTNSHYQFLETISTNVSTDVLYFAGCMTHLTPTIKKSMTELLNKSGVNWQFLDENDTICCGRPIKLSGKISEAQQLQQKNTELILKTGAKILVTSCPICYKTFKDDYQLPIPVMHHSQYIKQLLLEGKIKTIKKGLTVTYHDPCELGRLSEVYDEPRYVIRSVAGLKKTENEKSNSLCCGSSLAHFSGSDTDKMTLATQALQSLCKDNPDYVITSCPLCLKAFKRVSKTPVCDISELVNGNC